MNTTGRIYAEKDYVHRVCVEHRRFQHENVQLAPRPTPLLPACPARKWLLRVGLARSYL